MFVASGVGTLFGAVSAAPVVTLDLSSIIVVMLTVVGILVTAGIVSTRRTRRLQDAQTRKTLAEADGAEAGAILTHAQYEGFISEAAERLSHMSEAAIVRLEAELAKAQSQIAMLEAELARAKAERTEALADAKIREMELTAEIQELRDRVADLERRLESRGVAVSRRRGDIRLPPPITSGESENDP